MEEERLTQLSFRLPEELAREFKVACASRGTTLRFVLEQAVRRYVEQSKEKPE